MLTSPQLINKLLTITKHVNYPFADVQQEIINKYKVYMIYLLVNNVDTPAPPPLIKKLLTITKHVNYMYPFAVVQQEIINKYKVLYSTEILPPKSSRYMYWDCHDRFLFG